MRKSILLILLLFAPFCIVAQTGYHKPKVKKANNFKTTAKKPRKEYIVGIGASNFLGEVGGANQIGTNFVKDLEFKATRPSFSLGMRYKFASHFAVRGGFYYQLLSGADKLTQEPYRNNRNLSFKSSIFELSAQIEYFPLKEVTGHRYQIKNAKGMKNYDWQPFIFVGIGGFYYNPKAKYKGNWVALQPLGTEGQGLPGGAKKYSRVSICIPYGIGVKYGINKDWTVGLDVGIRKTFTDYIDDVSTVYYDNTALFDAHGEASAALADPSLLNYPASLGGDATGYQQSAAGQQRGDKKDKDAYMFLNVTVSYKMPYKRRTRSKF